MEYFLNNRVTLHCGDCRDVLRTLPDNSVDSVVTDPPYHLQSGANASSGFMGKKWDGGDIAFRPELWRDVLRVLKPGAHLLAFGGTRTYHRMVCAIEDAGFEIRDCVQWLYGNGFPKSLDVSKAIDKAAGVEREVIGQTVYGDIHIQNSQVGIGFGGCDPLVDKRLRTAPATDAARQWSGFGTALKPAVEMIVLARKPLSESTVAANVLHWGTGTLNIGGCLVGTTKDIPASPRKNANGGNAGGIYGRYEAPLADTAGWDKNTGRWPANVIHDGSEEVVAGFPSETANSHRPNPSATPNALFGNASYSVGERGYDDSGSAARFFYEVKPDTPMPGRWPANVIHDGSDEVIAGFPETTSGTLTAEHRRNGGHSKNRESEIFGKGSERGCAEDAFTYNANSGSAARFYYTAKADSDDRLGSSHPTVKPVDLMQYLCRLITPPRGLILDPFAGTGTTGEAAFREGFRAVLIESETQYQNDIRRRMKLALAGPDERKRESVKARGKPVDLGPLFANREAAE